MEGRVPQHVVPLQEALPTVTAKPGPQCPVCRGENAGFRFRNTDFLFRTTDELFDFYRCPACEAGFLHPPPDPRQLERAYSHGYWWVAGGRPTGTAGRLEEKYREWVLLDHVRVVERCFHVPEPSVLDVGCGSGTFLSLLQRRTRAQVRGLEPSPEACAAIRERYGLDVTQGDIEGAEFPQGTFDVVTMFHVLEHLSRPRQAVEKVSRWLKPGGVLLLQTPNLASWQSALFGRRWTGIDIPRHVTGYTPRTLSMLFDMAGLEPSFSRHFSLRDSAPAIASSLFPGLDPVANGSRGGFRVAFAREILYFSIVLPAQLFALLEAAAKRGGCVFAAARKPGGNKL